MLWFQILKQLSNYLCHTFKYYGSNAKGKGVKGGENEKRGEKEKERQL